MTDLFQPTILITGETGSVGLVFAKQLADKQIAFRALIRSLDKAELLKNLKGVTLVIGDFNHEQSILKGYEE